MSDKWPLTDIVDSTMFVNETSALPVDGTAPDGSPGEPSRRDARVTSSLHGADDRLKQVLTVSVGESDEKAYKRIFFAPRVIDVLTEGSRQ